MMEENKKFVYVHSGYDTPFYYKYGKLSNDQSCMICFIKYQRHKKSSKVASIDYFVSFAIANKKKHLLNYMFSKEGYSICLKETGNAGFEGLIWAYKQIKEFEDVPYAPFNIIVMGEDTRRFRIYEHFLKREGYKKISHPIWGWCLRKTIYKKLK